MKLKFYSLKLTYIQARCTQLQVYYVHIGKIKAI